MISSDVPQSAVQGLGEWPINFLKKLRINSLIPVALFFYSDFENIEITFYDSNIYSTELLNLAVMFQLLQVTVVLGWDIAANHSWSN